MNYTIRNEYYELTVTSLGAEMTSLISQGKELLWNSPNKEWWSSHAPLLFPACGRIKDSKYTYGGKTYEMNTHGFIKNKDFALVNLTESSVTLAFSADEETKKNYPFDFIFTAKYELIGTKVNFSVSIENTDDKVMPYMFGWHPGFNLFTDASTDIGDYKIDFGNINSLTWIPLCNIVFASKIGKPYPINSGLYPLNEKEIYENDTMIFKGHNNAIRLFANENSYILKMSWSDNLPMLCIWKEPENSAKFICLEPWSGVPNDGETEENFETRDMARLAPGKAETYSYSLEFAL